MLRVAVIGRLPGLSLVPAEVAGAGDAADRPFAGRRTTHRRAPPHDRVRRWRRASALPERQRPRLSIPLPPELVQARNVISIETRPGVRLLVGGLAVEAQLADGRLLRTPVDQQLHATCDDWDAWEEPRLRHVAAGQPLRALLSSP